VHAIVRNMTSAKRVRKRRLKTFVNSVPPFP